MNEQQQSQAPTPSSSARPARRRQGGKKPSSALFAEQRKHTKMSAATEKRDPYKNGDEHHISSRGNDHSTNVIDSATKMAHQQLRRQQQNTEKSLHQYQSKKQEVATANYKRRHHHKRQSPPRRQQQQQNRHIVEEEANNFLLRRRQQQSKIGGVVDKQMRKQKNGGASVACHQDNILQVDEVIRAARRRYGSANDRKGSSINLAAGGRIDIAVGSKKEIGSKRKNVGQQKKKFQPKQDKQNNNNGHWRNDRQQFRKSNDNKTPVTTHNDGDDSSLPDDYVDKVIDNIQLGNEKNAEGKNVACNANPHEFDGEESLAGNCDKNVSLPLPQTSQSTSLTRTEQELETQCHHAMKVQISYSNENEECEDIECNLDCVEMVPSHSHQYHFSNRLANDDDEKRKSDEIESDNCASEEEVESRGSDDSHQDIIKVQASTLGKNGWHRFLGLLNSPPADDINLSSAALDDEHIPNQHTLKSIGESDNKLCIGDDNKNTTLDQQTVTNMLGNPQYAPILSEKEALREEYEMLQREIESLEQDRMALESLFYKIEVEKRSPSRRFSDLCEESYRAF